MLQQPWRRVARRAHVDTVSSLRQHWVGSFSFAAIMMLVGVAIGVARGEGEWQAAMVGLAAAVVMVFVMTLVYQAYKANGRLQSDDAVHDFSQIIGQVEKDVVFLHLQASLGNPRTGVVDACLFGSAVVVQPPPNDVDIAVRFEELSKPELVQANARLSELAEEFKERFGHPLHFQRFLHCEGERIMKFNQSAEPRKNIMGDIWS